MPDPYTALDIDTLLYAGITREEAERLLAAEEFCWGFTNAVGLGLLDPIPVADRTLLVEFTGYDDWSDLAVATGILPKGEDDENYEPGPVPGYLY